MDNLVTDLARQRAAILADALDDTVAELRLIDPGDIIAYIRAGQWANIADLVNSSAELSFREGAMTFACAADFALDWASSPSIALEMEFQGHAISAFFTLVLDRDAGMVSLRRVWFPIEPDDAAQGTLALALAVADARLGRGSLLPTVARQW